MKPAKDEYTILKQICNLIPAYLVPKLAGREVAGLVTPSSIPTASARPAARTGGSATFS